MHSFTCIALLILSLVVRVRGTFDPANWIGASLPLTGELTPLDLSLPGTHDTLTADLSETIADNANDLPPELADLLHEFVPRELIGSFIRTQAQTQGLTITEQLSAGVRFLDFRITYTLPPNSDSGAYDWYGLHLVQTKRTALAYLHEIKEWLLAHPSEFVVLPFTKHGSFCKNGTNQYPGTTPEIRQKFWKQVEDLFGDLLVDHRKVKVNETSISEMLRLKGRVIVYASDYHNFTASSPRALDSCLIFNDLQGGVYSEKQSAPQQLTTFANAAETKEKLKRENRFFLMSLASSGSGSSIKFAVYLHFQPFDHANIRRDCSALFQIPNVSSWCPMTLLEMSQTAEYYNQRVLARALSEGYEFPNAIYTGAYPPRNIFVCHPAKLTPPALRRD
jgi:hypothetical protein